MVPKVFEQLKFYSMHMSFSNANEVRSLVSLNSSRGDKPNKSLSITLWVMNYLFNMLGCLLSFAMDSMLICILQRKIAVVVTLFPTGTRRRNDIAQTFNVITPHRGHFDVTTSCAFWVVKLF